VNLIDELYALQAEHGYLREEDLRSLSARTKTPLYEIQAVSSFYPHFRRTPPARVTVSVCRDLSCRMAGGEQTTRELRQLCARHADVEFHEVSCLGRCDTAPAVAVNEVPVDAARVGDLVADPSALPADEPTTTPHRWNVDPYGSRDEHYGVLREAATTKSRRAWIDEHLDRLEKSGLRGMGGAGFPTGLKWKLVRRETATPKYVVCNADESEPGTFKDRVVLEELPHLVVEGIALGAFAIGAQEAWIYIRHEYGREAKAIRREIARAYELGALGPSVFGSGHRIDLKVFVSPGGYILGEETALLEALEGRRGEPRNKPPYPGTNGLFDLPTLINNVETLANVPYVFRTGKADWKFFSVSGDVSEPGVHEVQVGTTLNGLIERCGGMKDGKKLLAYLPGGASTQFLRADQADVPLTWKDLAQAGSALGSGAVVVVAEGRDLMDCAKNLTEFFRNESCGKCVPCRIGTEKAVVLMEGRKPEDLARIAELHETLSQTSICGLGQAALNPILSVLERFPPAE